MHTFHGWFAQLVQGAPPGLLTRLGLPQRMELIEDLAPLLPALFRRFHLAVLRDKDLRADYAGLVAVHRRSTVQHWLERAVSLEAEVRCADEAGTLQDAVSGAASLDARCAGLADPAALLFLAPLHARIAALAERLQTRAGAKRRKAGARLSAALSLALPAAQAAQAAAPGAQDIRAAFEMARSALFTEEDLPRKLGDVADLAPLCDEIEAINVLVVQHDAQRDHARMVRLVRVLLAELRALKRERGRVDMNDLERAARVMLSDAEVQGWLQERLDLQLRQVLIDEFQDTSPLQWHALHGWLSAYAGAGGGASGQRAPAVFIVGDPKQSIYRFRRAEPRVFAAAKTFVTQGLGGAMLASDHTRRNATDVISSVNAVFMEAAASGAWQDFRAHTTSNALSGETRCLPEALREEEPDGPATPPPPQEWRPSLTQARLPPEERLRVIEARSVADAIAELVGQRGFKPGEVMVLARKRDPLRDVAEALAADGIPHVMPEALTVQDSPEALDLVALLDVLASPGHNLSLARALKSPLFAADDDELLWLAQQADGAPWLAALLAGAPTTSALQRAQGLLRGWLALVQSLAPHDLIDRIVHEGDLLARLAAAVPPARTVAAADAVSAVLAAAIDQDGGRYVTLYALVRALLSGELKMPRAAPADAVQLLTVHGAKGLQARAVFVVDTDPNPMPAKSGVVLVDWPVELQAPRSVAFIVRESRAPSSLQALLALELVAREREELNALYVAMTRAVELLVCSRTQPRYPAAALAWWSRVAPHASLWTPTLPTLHESTLGDEVLVPTLPTLHRRRVMSRVTSSATSGAAAPSDSSASRTGQAVHRMLEWAGRPDAPAVPAQWPALADAAVRAFGLPPSSARAVHDIAAAVLTGPQSRRFFAHEDLLWAGNEVALAGPGAVLRVDRLVQLRAVPQAQWWVIDYKLHAAPDEVQAYREQMAGYLNAMRALLPGEVVLGAFITAGGRVIEV